MKQARWTLLLAGMLGFAPMRNPAATPRVEHDPGKKRVTMADAERNLVLRLDYDGKCMLDQVNVRGRDVVSEATGVCSAIKVTNQWFTTRSGVPTPQLHVTDRAVTVSGIRFGGGGVEVAETWTFTVHADYIVWRIDRTYRSGGTLEDTYFAGWDFKDMSTWTGALLGHGGVAWGKLFDAPNSSYGVHNGKVTFWNKDHRSCLRIVPVSPTGGKIAARFSRQPSGIFSFNHSVTDKELVPKQGQSRFRRDRQDIWQPFAVAGSTASITYTLSALDYEQAYDRGRLVGIDGWAIREICHTIARIGAIDELIHGSNGYYSGYAVLHEQWIAQMGLAIDDPDYFRAYADTLDYQRDHAVGPDGRVKSRWAYGPWDAMPGTYDPLGFYECQWGWLMDTQPNWVINVAEQFDFTGDVAWLKKHKHAGERVLDYLLERDSNHNGLVEMMTDSHTQGKSSDWIDVVKASFENALVNAELFQALTLWTDVEELLGDRDRASRYAECARRLKASFNRTIAEGGFWDPANQWYIYWREKDGSIHGNCLVTPVNFMALAYGICDEPARRSAVLRCVEEQMQKEKLFFWPLNMFSYTTEDASGMVFPTYENGDLFLGWGELGIRAYAPDNPAVAVRCVKSVLEQYARDGLAFQRYLRQSQKGAGDDILANNCSPVVGLYRNIYGIQPKHNRLYLEPHLVPELNGTQLKYQLRGQWYLIDLNTAGCRISVAGFSVHDTKPFAVNVGAGTAEYFSGDRKRPSLSLFRPLSQPLEIRIESWSGTGTGQRKWMETWPKAGTSIRHVLGDLQPNQQYKLYRNGALVESLRSNANGQVAFEPPILEATPQSFEIVP